MTTIKVIIPAYNEEKAIGHVIVAIPKIVNEIIVISNNSTDNTKAIAKNAGATVLSENKMGYGYACLKGLEYIASQEIKPDIVVFLDGDYSDYPEELTQLIAPIVNQNIDFVIGSRVSKLREKGSMTPQQVFGNWLASFLMKLFYNAKFTDLGPFRAIKYQTLLDLQMQDKTYGWTVEMQLKILKQNFTYVEIPVRYKNRIGVSKVSGTLKGTVMAGIKIIGWIFKYTFK
ncbi:glycosyltransferase family 2 protein [Flavobacterium bizetiae]|uniref:glycosyltransferase family 2 protein n=1 Tax=Flavobacterium bizetiae TaxID=2704140 RepID=UPI003757FD10